jgi:squalene-hopene/tetraprenyl-beta-curcumene cyclase
MQFRVLLTLAIEAVAIALVYPVVGVASSGLPAARILRRLGALLALHSVLAAIGFAALGSSVEEVARGRAVMATAALAAFGLALVAMRALRDEALAATTAVIAMLAAVLAPAIIEAAAGAAGRLAAPLRTLSLAVSPIVAAAGNATDVLHLPDVYERAPAAVMETHMVAWSWTVLGWSMVAAVAILGAAALARRAAQLRFNGSALALALGAVALSAIGCERQAAVESQAKPAATVPAETNAAAATAPVAAPAALDTKAVQDAIDKGVAFLLKSRAANGSIGGHPGVTSLALWAIALAPNGPKKDDPRVQSAVASVVKLARSDGSFSAGDYPAYTTALALLAFQAFGIHPELVAKGQKWLAAHQFSDGTGTKPSDVNFGGIGYGDDHKADLSNLHFALEALKETHFKARPEVYARAIKFIERCQNRSESNDQKWASNDGGFVYRPGESKAGGTKSSASMTYAGLQSFIYSNVPSNDGRVRDAFEWVRTHYSLDENPGLGQKGLYFYYHAMARTLALLGENTITDAQGVKHDWYPELAHKILSMQKPDGSWVNPDPTYWESNPAVATPRALLALELGLAEAAGK